MEAVRAIGFACAVLLSMPLAGCAYEPTAYQERLMLYAGVTQKDYPLFHSAAVRLSKEFGYDIDTCYSVMATYMHEAGLIDLAQGEAGARRAIIFSRTLGIVP